MEMRKRDQSNGPGMEPGLRASGVRSWCGTCGAYSLQRPLRSILSDFSVEPFTVNPYLVYCRAYIVTPFQIDLPFTSPKRTVSELLAQP